MKKYICIFAAFAAVLSCQKETPVIPSSTETLSVPATLEIINPMTKLGIGTDSYVWTEGDQICVRQTNSNEPAKTELKEKSKNALIATSSGECSIFSGNLTSPYAKSLWYIFYPFSAFSDSTSPHLTSGIKLTLPGKQSGTFDEYSDGSTKYSRLGECLMMTTDNFKVGVDKEQSQLTEDETMYSNVVFKSVQMNILTPVIKLTIPEELEVKKITFKAYKNDGNTSTPHDICGAFKMTMSTREITTIPGEIYSKPASYQEITIRRNGLISGDVYITIHPDLVKGNEIGTTNSANELYFKFQTTINESDRNYRYFEITKSISDQNKLTAGTVLDLGTVPTTLEFIKPNASSQASVNFSGTVPSTTPAE
jgi:hypothetical protein